MNINRRHFLQGCCAGIIAMQGVKFGGVSFAQAPGSGPNDVVVSIFLRGGMDSLSLLIPHGDADYATARAQLKMNASQVLDIDGYFGLHPAAAGMLEIMNAGHMAIVCAAGSPDSTRSHFEAQDNMELGVLGNAHYAGGGWLARQMNLTGGDSVFKGVSYGQNIERALEGFGGALALNGAGGFSLSGDWTQADDLRRSLREMYAWDAELGQTALRTLDAIDVIDRNDPQTYVPGNGATYANNGAANGLKAIAQMIRMNIGLNGIQMSVGGWDTHESQANGGGNSHTGYFADRIRELSDGLRSFWTDLRDYHGKVTVVMMSEFGRRLKENDNRGTDHGRAGIMTVISSDVAEGRVYGNWPGLGYEQLADHVDLAVTTDFREVLSELVWQRTPNSNLAAMFPGYTFGGGLGIFGQLRTSASDAWTRMAG